MKCIVTGGAGFIGSHVVEQLLEQGFEVLVIDDFSTTMGTRNEEQCTEFIDKVKLHPKFLGLVDHDLSENWQGDTLTQIFYGFDFVFHLAAHPRVDPSIKDPVMYHRLNVDSTLNVLEAARHAKVSKVIFSSSSSIYGDPLLLPTPEHAAINPMSPYGLHKQIGEEYCKLYTLLYGMSTVCLRYMNVFGERQPFSGAYVPVIGIWFDQYVTNKPLTITGDGSQTRDFVYVGDVARANIVAAMVPQNSSHAAYNVGSGVNYKISDIASWFDQRTVFIPKRFEPHTTQADISLIKQELNWEPLVDLKDYVEKTLNDARKNFDSRTKV